MRFPGWIVGLDTIHRLEQELRISRHPVTFDLSLTEFISPIGAVWSLLTTDMLRSEGRFVNVLPPMIVGPVSWLERFNFFEMADPAWYASCASVHDLELLQNRRRNDMKRHLVELQRIDGAHSVHTVCDSIEEVLLAHGRSLTNRIKAIVTELTNNIVDHSQSHGYVAVQYYPSRHRVEIALGDVGIGVAQSLQPFYKRESRNKIVQNAFKDRVSSLVNEDRGYGLGEVRTRATEGNQHYEFRMLTNGGVYRIFDDRIEEVIDGEHVPYGTYYEIKIWE
jgi:hypothetical protein